MNLLNSKTLKIFISLMFIGFAYHYFLLGTTSISKLMETSNNKKIEKIDKFSDKNKIILLNKDNIDNNKESKLTQNEKRVGLIDDKKNPSIIIKEKKLTQNEKKLDLIDDKKNLNIIINETNTIIFDEEETKKELFASVENLKIEKIKLVVEIVQRELEHIISLRVGFLIIELI